MERKFVRSLLFLLAVVLIASCTKNKDNIRITGTIELHGSEEWKIEAQPIHYKYGETSEYPLTVDSQGKFRAMLRPNKEHRPFPAYSSYFFYSIKTGNQSYPLFLENGKSYECTIDRVDFPQNVNINGYSNVRLQKYRTYLGIRDSIHTQIDRHLEAFQQGDTSKVLQLQRSLMRHTDSIFTQAPMRRYYYYELGEYVHRKLLALQHKKIWDQDSSKAAAARSRILTYAKKNGFFSYESQLAQRAGIRDVANAYSMTFGIQENIREQYGRDLLIYDVKRLGFNRFDSAKRELLSYIDTERARAYARMYLIAERIGDYSISKGQSSYDEFMDTYSDYPGLQEFLKNLYQKRKRVSRGQPAFDFSLPDSNGTQYALKDFKGKITLLDFWASWCVPCMEEMDDIKGIYQKYSREDFEVVSISIEKDSSQWLRTIRQRKPPWIQLYAGKQFEQPLFEKYMGGGIPFYVLIDRKGRILRYNDIHASFNLDSVLHRHIRQ